LALRVFRRSLRDQRWQIVGFGGALFLMAMTSVALWPSARDALQNIKLPDAVQAFLGTKLSIATAAGYLSARYFGWVEILLIVYVIIQGTGAIAGEESAGTMDLLLAQPVSRTRVVIEKAAATALGAALAIAFGWLGFAATVPFVSIDISVVDCAVASANMLPVTLFFYTLALASGAAAPNRGSAVAVVVGVATATYFMSVLAAGVDALEWLRYGTPFYYYGSGTPLVEGINWGHVALLLGLAAALLGLAVASFRRRDITTSGASDVDLFGGLQRLLTRRPANAGAS